MNSIYFPWATKIPTTTITPHAAPTRKEPEPMAKEHTAAAAPDNVVIICLLVIKSGFPVGAGAT